MRRRRSANRRDSYPERIVHGSEAVIRVAGPRQKRAVYLEELGVVDPLQNPFRAANRDHHVSGPGRLEDQPDRDRVVAPAGFMSVARSFV